MVCGDMPRQIFYDDILTLSMLEIVHNKGREKLLMLAVLIEALNCINLPELKDSIKYRKRQIFIDAQNWFREDDFLWPFSFVNICTELDIDPGYLRAGILKRPSRNLRRGKTRINIHIDK